MAQISEQNTENDAQEHSAPSHSTAVSEAGMSAGLPSPLSDASAPLPSHLQDLTDRARGYVEAASSANTRRAYASDWKHFSSWLSDARNW